MNTRSSIFFFTFAATLIIGMALAPANSRATETILVISSDQSRFTAVASGFRNSFPGEFREINLDGDDKKQKTVGEELQVSKPSVAIVVGDLAGQMAKWHLADVPVIYCHSPRAAEIELTTQKAAGIYHESDPVEQLKSLHDLFPDKNRIGLLYSPEYTPINEQRIIKKARDLGLSLKIGAANKIEEVPGKFRELVPGIDLLWALTDPVVISKHSKKFIIMESFSAKVPTFCGDHGLAYGGATAGLAPDFENAGKLAAEEARAVLSGKMPQPGTVRYPGGKLVLNTKAASLMSVSFPPSLAAKAEVIE